LKKREREIKDSEGILRELSPKMEILDDNKGRDQRDLDLRHA
jgi:hypothetical protein